MSRKTVLFAALGLAIWPSAFVQAENMLAVVLGNPTQAAELRGSLICLAGGDAP